jgi:hypothetical protein
MAACAPCWVVAAVKPNIIFAMGSGGAKERACGLVWAVTQGKPVIHVINKAGRGVRFYLGSYTERVTTQTRHHVSICAGREHRIGSKSLLLVIGPKPEESDQIASIPSLFSLRRSAVRTTGTFDASNRCKVVNTAGWGIELREPTTTACDWRVETSWIQRGWPVMMLASALEA